MDHERVRELNLRRREIGLEIHEVSTTIYLGRQAIRALREEEPVDHEAMSLHYAAIRAAHRRHHELQHPLARVKEDLYREYSWPPKGPLW